MAYLNGMTLRIDKSGRIVVPKALRIRLGLRPDAEIEAVEQSEGVLIRAVLSKPAMAKVDGLWVHEGVAETSANWNKIIDDVREERSRSIGSC
jgi:AbrB family looped-hinge helix DNA binding protein